MLPVKKTIRILMVLAVALQGCHSDQASTVDPQSGKGGSMARFAITGNSLYIVDNQSLHSYDISTPGNPQKSGSKSLGIGIETIYPYQNNLFIGAQDGMYIFNNVDPSNPQLITKYQHVQSCDPVVVQDSYAYVTLRGGAACRNGAATASSLDVVDLSDMANPKMLHTQNMLSPYGLGVSGKLLFVCEGTHGLKTFDIQNPKLPVLIGQNTSVDAYDVIVRNSGSLILIGKKGLYQFSFDENAGELMLLSQIPVQ